MTTNIPLQASEVQNAPLKAAILTEIAQMVSRPGGLTDSGPIERMEAALAQMVGLRHAVGVSSGTGALEIGLRALGLPPGTEVITPALSYAATAQAVLINGLVPVFADVDPSTGCVTEKTVSAVLTPRVRAVIAADLFGRQVPVAPLRRLCQRQGLYLVEDAAQSLGVRPRDPDLFLTSFNPSKPCGAWGNGGAILTDDPEMATRIREIRNQGGLIREDCRRLGTNGWIDPIQAMVVQHKLPYLETWMKLRQTLAMAYWRALEPWQHRQALRLPPLPMEEQSHNWFRFTIQVPAKIRDTLRDTLSLAGISTGRVYSRPLPQQPLFRVYAKHPTPGADQMASQGVHLPLFAEMSGKQVAYVVERVEQCLKPNSMSFSTSL